MLPRRYDMRYGTQQDRECGNPEGGAYGGREGGLEPRLVVEPCGSGLHRYEIECN